LYIKAAEGFLHLSRGTEEEACKARSKKEAAKALERAEKIKDVKGKNGLRDVEVDIWSDGACPLLRCTDLSL
jgi:calpain-7